MRILFSSLPAHGHVYPLVPLALAARRAGHRVRFATGPTMHASLRAFGLPTAPAGMTIFEGFLTANGGPVDRAAMTAERGAWLRAETFGAVLPRAFLADLEPLLAAERPDLVVHEVANLGAYFAARRARIPGVCHGVGRVADGAADAVDGRLAAFAEEVGVPYPGGFARGGGDPYLDLYPPSMQGRAFLAAPYRIPMRPVAVAEPGELPGWVTDRDRSRPLVYLTLGTGFGTVAVFREAIAGLSELDCDVLAATGPAVDPAALGPVPGTVRAVPWVPQADLLRHADLVVHHGGSGTTLATLAAGLPQLLLPQGADQFGNAEAVSTTGAGARLLPGQCDAARVASETRRLLTDPTVAARAREVAAEIAALPSPDETVPVLTAHARHA